MTHTTAIQRAEQWRKENACGEAAKVAIALLNELQVLQAKHEKEIVALHAKLAGETLRADQGWQRYEAANTARNNAELALSRAIPEGHVVVPGWISKSDCLPPEGMYLVHSSYGIHCAYRHDPEWADCFQDVGSQCDEGMQDDYGKLFEVYAWMPLPAAPANKEGA